MRILLISTSTSTFIFLKDSVREKDVNKMSFASQLISAVIDLALL